MGVLQIARCWNSAADLPDVSKCFLRIRSKHPCQRPPRYFAWGCFRYFSWKRESRRPLRLPADACSAEFTTRQSSRLACASERCRQIPAPERDRYRLEFRRFARHSRNSRYSGSSRSCLLACGTSTAADAAAAPAEGELRSIHYWAAWKRVQPATGAFSATSFHFGWNGGRCNCAIRVKSDSTSNERRR